MRFVTSIVMVAVACAFGYWLTGHLGVRDEIAAVLGAIWRGIVWVADRIPAWADALARGWETWVSST